MKEEEDELIEFEDQAWSGNGEGVDVNYDLRELVNREEEEDWDREIEQNLAREEIF